MTLPLVYHRLARNEVDEAYDWYEAKEAGKGDGFLSGLRAAVARLHQQPLLRAANAAGLRAEPIRKCRYIVYYRVERARALIVAVQDGRRRPRQWRNRR